MRLLSSVCVSGSYCRASWRSWTTWWLWTVTVFFLPALFFFLTAGFVRVVAAAWLECFTRGLAGLLGGGAGRRAQRANEATSATETQLIVLRIIIPPSVASYVTPISSAVFLLPFYNPL